MTNAHEPIDLVIRKTYAQTKACFITTRNLQIEVQELRNELAETRKQIASVTTLFLTLLDDPETRNKSEAVARDLRIHTYKKPL